MIDILGNDAIKLQKEIMDITYNINTVKNRAHRSMSSILNKLKSFPKNKASLNNHLDLSSLKIKNFFKKNLYYHTSRDDINKNMKKEQKNIHSSDRIENKLFYDYLDPKSKNGLNDTQFIKKINKNKEEDIYTRTYLLFGNNLTYDTQTNNELINNNSNPTKSTNNVYILNEDNSLRHQFLYNNKKLAKTDSQKSMYNKINFSNDYIYNNNENKNIYNKNNYFENGILIDNNTNNKNNYYKREFSQRLYHNNFLNEDFDVNKNYNLKSRNNFINNFNHKDIEIQKNNDEFSSYEDYCKQKEAKPLNFKYYHKNNINNYNSISNNKPKNNVTNKTITKRQIYTHPPSFYHHKSKKNIFREKTAIGKIVKNCVEKDNSNNYNELIINKKSNKNNKKEKIEKNNNDINNIYKLLKVTNTQESINKINELLKYEDFIHQIKKIYYNFNDHNNDFKLKDILFWITYNFNSKNKENNNDNNKYEEYCKKIMKKYKIKNFDNFKMFFNELIMKDKNSYNFMNEMKELLVNSNDFRPNRTISRSMSRKNIINLDTKNEDDISSH